MTTFTHTSTMEVIECCNCGMLFGMTADFNRRRHEDKGFFHCPQGHPQSYTKSEVQKLKDELQRERAAKDQAKADAQWQRDQRERAEKTSINLRGQITKVKKRIGNGICPCCNRHFSNLVRHMDCKHPEYRKGESTADRRPE